ncbi:uncharacterized protein [Periplaneta americana]
MEGDEDFGFVERDDSLLHKALTRVEPSPQSGESDPNNNGSSDTQQVAPEQTGNDTDVTSGDDALESICEDDAAVPSDGVSSRKLAGTLQDSPAIEQLGHVYDASKRKTSVASVTSVASATSTGSNRSAKPPGILRNMSSGVSPVKPAAAEVREDDLPQSFQVKYLGERDARGLWGIKHTRRPVDSMVAAAKSLKAGTVLPLVKLVVSREGVSVVPAHKKAEETLKFHPIDTISYGVQDLVYTRVFSMIVVREGADLKGQHPFECHAFVCDSRGAARKLTYALASAFNEYSKLVKARGGADKEAVKKRFAIDLRSPEEIEADLNSPQPEDSEA